MYKIIFLGDLHSLYSSMSAEFIANKMSLKYQKIRIEIFSLDTGEREKNFI